MARKQYVCRNCGKTGHNARTCGSSLTYRAATSSPRAKREKKVKKEQNSLPKIQSNNGSWRKCSYCHNAGHNYRNCLAAKEDKKNYLEVAQKLFNQIADYTNKLGLTPGCLVESYSRVNAIWRLGDDANSLLDSHSTSVARDKLSKEQLETLSLLKTNFENEKDAHKAAGTWDFDYTITYVLLLASNLSNSLIIDSYSHINDYSLVNTTVYFGGAKVSERFLEGTNNIQHPATLAFLSYVLELELELMQKSDDFYFYLSNFLADVVNGARQSKGGYTLNITNTCREKIPAAYAEHYYPSIKVLNNGEKAAEIAFSFENTRQRVERRFLQPHGIRDKYRHRRKLLEEIERMNKNIG